MSEKPAWTNDIERLCREYSLSPQTEIERPESLTLRVTSSTEISTGFIVKVVPSTADSETLLISSWDIDYSLIPQKDESLLSLASEVIAASEPPYSASHLSPDTAVPLYGVSWTSDPVFNVHVAISSYTNWVSWHHWMREFFATYANTELALTAPADPLTEINLWINRRRVDFAYRNESTRYSHLVDCFVWPQGIPVPSLAYSLQSHGVRPEWQTRIALPAIDKRILRPDSVAIAYEQVINNAPRYLFN